MNIMNTFKEEVIAKLAGPKGKFGWALSAFFIISEVPYQVYPMFSAVHEFLGLPTLRKIGTFGLAAPIQEWLGVEDAILAF